METSTRRGIFGKPSVKPGDLIAFELPAEVTYVVTAINEKRLPIIQILPTQEVRDQDGNAIDTEPFLHTGTYHKVGSMW